MSEVVDEMPSRGHFPRKYAWERWRDGRIHVLTAGVDFVGTPRRLRRAAYRHGEEHGFRVSSSVEGDRVWLRFMRRSAYGK